MPSHYLIQCWYVRNWVLGNKLQWNLNKNRKIFIEENALEIMGCKIVATLSQPQFVKSWGSYSPFRVLCPRPQIYNLVKSLFLRLYQGMHTLRISVRYYSQVPLLHGLIYHDITYDSVIIAAESESNIRITTDIPYLALKGELWCVYCEDFNHLNGTALYSDTHSFGSRTAIYLHLLSSFHINLQPEISAPAHVFGGDSSHRPYFF